MRTLAQFWPYVLGAVTFIATVVGLVAKWQTVKKNRREEKTRAAEQQRSRAGVVFEKIRVDRNNQYWAEWTPSDVGPVAPRLRMECANCKQFFYISDVVSHADPSFDVILRNDGPRNTTILSVGVRVTRVAHYSYELPIAGDIKKAQKLMASEAYSIQMPNIISEVQRFDFDEDAPPVNVDRLIRENCEPYLLSPEGRFRYTLVLNKYGGMPNNSIIRFWLETNEGTQESSDLYLRYGNT